MPLAATVLICFFIFHYKCAPSRRPPASLDEALDEPVPPRGHETDPPGSEARVSADPPERQPPAKGAASSGAPPAAAQARAGLREPPWLLAFIPTVPRKNKEDYLIQTLRSWAPSIPPRSRTMDPLAGKVRLAVVANRAGHDVFREAREAFESDEVLFHERSYAGRDPFPDAPPPSDPVNQPDARVRTQTFDVADGIRIALRLAAGMDPEAPGLPPAELLPAFFGFFEDDFELCPNAFHALVHATRKAFTYCPDCSALRVSTGLNGVIVKGANASALADYLDRHARRRPPDHLVSEWYLAEKPDAALTPPDGRAGNMAYRWNILSHLGRQSSIKPDVDRSKNEWPGCWTPLSWMLFEKEMFYPSECPNDDVWPCRWDYDSEEAANKGPPPPKERDEKKRRLPGIRPAHLDRRTLPVITFAAAKPPGPAP
eukprot:tig00020556_g10986.t1